MCYTVLCCTRTIRGRAVSNVFELVALPHFHVYEFGNKICFKLYKCKMYPYDYTMYCILTLFMGQRPKAPNESYQVTVLVLSNLKK